MLPVELTDRRGGLVRAGLSPGDLPFHNKLRLTSEGEANPIMRIGGSADETRRLWSALRRRWPRAPLLGGLRPGATVLALTTAPGGGVFRW